MLDHEGLHFTSDVRMSHQVMHAYGGMPHSAIRAHETPLRGPPVDDSTESSRTPYGPLTASCHVYIIVTALLCILRDSVA
jgi:hypothetical protein